MIKKLSDIVALISALRFLYFYDPSESLMNKRDIHFQVYKLRL